MRPTSIIFLILSVVLIIAGIITCSIAKGMAESDGINLFEQSTDENDNIVYNYNFTGDSLNKIELILDDADVNIYGGAEESYIELYNFKVNTYGLSTSNSILSLDDTASIMSILNLTSGGIKFKGLRYYLNFTNLKNKEKTVNIYLADGYNIKILNITVKKGNVYADNIPVSIDYNIDIGSGDINIKNINTASAGNFTVKNGNITVSDSVIATLTADIGNGDFKLNTSDSDYFTYSLLTGLGSVYIDGEDKGGLYNIMSGAQTSSIKVNVDAGNIVLTNIAK